MDGSSPCRGPPQDVILLRFNLPPPTLAYTAPTTPQNVSISLREVADVCILMKWLRSLTASILLISSSLRSCAALQRIPRRDWVAMLVATVEMDITTL